MIEMIAHTFTSSRYYLCRFTFIETGKSLLVDVGGLDGNGLPMKLFDDHSKTYKVNETIGYKLWEEIAKGSDCVEHQALSLLKKMLVEARS